MKDRRKYPISRERFEKLVEPIIKNNKKKLGRPTKIGNYNFVCGILYVLRTGIPWRDLPKDYGNWHTIYTRYKRWSAGGFFWHLLYKLQSFKKLSMDVIFIDSSIVPLHRHGSGALKKERSTVNR